MKTIITLSLLLSALICQAQDNYLTIYKSDSPYDQISYPPNTRFELKDQTGKVVFTQNIT